MIPDKPMLIHAGHNKIWLANVLVGGGDIPVMIVKISDVAMLEYSPVLKAATASAEAVNTAISKRTQPKKRPKNIFNLLFCYVLFV